MTVAELEHFRDLLHERRDQLTDWVETEGSDHAAEAQRVQTVLTEIRDALGRVDTGGFGECVVCKGTVEMHRLEVQPVSQVCLECITDAERTVLEEELYLASKIHRALLPQQVEKIDGFEVAVKSLAANVVGGDYYDFLPGGNGNLVRVVIADAMGKGLPAGLVMSNLQGALRVLANEIESPAALIARLNSWLCRNIPVTKFISLACIALKPSGANTIITYANAGHHPPILVRRDGPPELLDSTGTVIGVHEDFVFAEKTLAMHPGDLLLLYTDGVTEAENPHGDMFGAERLVDFTRNRNSDPPAKIIDDLIDELLYFSDRPEFADDMTVIALRKAG